MANENMQMSAAGIAALTQRERIALRYYDDVANNCTFGVGTLAHYGPCTTEELRRPVTLAQVHAQLTLKVRSAEATVRRRVSDQQLPQDQFDALVSFVYNVGSTGASTTLDAVNRGHPNDAAAHIDSNIYMHPRDSQGHRLGAVRSNGLANRRREESAPFRRQAGR